jgi:hypothetical protein
MLDLLRRAPTTGAMEPMPGWLARRKADLPPAREVLAAIPGGAVVPQTA